jgi:hypothetical protein
MADITVQNAAMAGVALSMGAAAANDTVPVQSGERVCLVVANASGGSINVTVTAQTTSATVPGYGSVTLANEVVAVADGATEVIGPFTDAFINSSRQAEIAYSDTTSITRTALKFGTPA